MNRWNYRVGKKVEYWSSEPIVTYGIIEAYYEGDEVKGYTGFVGPQGDSLEELKADMQKMVEAFGKPIFEMDDEEDLTNV